MLLTCGNTIQKQYNTKQYMPDEVRFLYAFAGRNVLLMMLIQVWFSAIGLDRIQLHKAAGFLAEIIGPRQDRCCLSIMVNLLATNHVCAR